jgi:hypothetical protein
MKYKNPLRMILSENRLLWDTPAFPPTPRRAFQRFLQCRTEELGAEVFASGDQRFTVPHTCKSPACPSCGYWAMRQWVRQRLATLPNIEFLAITFTMPDLLWLLFRDNPRLAAALPAIASAAIQSLASAMFGVRVGLIAVLQTFNGYLEYNPHVHTMVTVGGIAGNGLWDPAIHHDTQRLMESWRKAVTALLRAGIQMRSFRSEMSSERLFTIFQEQEERWWHVKVQSSVPMRHFLLYAGRYLRRPPIASHRITYIGTDVVRFRVKDKQMGQLEVELPVNEFIERWAQHVPAHYQHGVRNFGLFAPRALAGTSAALFSILREEPKSRPPRLRWAETMERDFGKNPLRLPSGEKMVWVGRVGPQLVAGPAKNLLD